MPAKHIIASGLYRFNKLDPKNRRLSLVTSIEGFRAIAAHIEDPLWRGKYPNPFHMVFSMDGAKLYLSVLHPAPASSGVMVVDTKTWKIKKEIQGIGPDMQTLAVTYDGKYVIGVFSGFQRLASGIAFIDAQTDELVGLWPSNGGHHDCVIIPTELEHMKHTRSCTL